MAPLPLGGRLLSFLQPFWLSDIARTSIAGLSSHPFRLAASARCGQRVLRVCCRRLVRTIGTPSCLAAAPPCVWRTMMDRNSLADTRWLAAPSSACVAVRRLAALALAAASALHPRRRRLVECPAFAGAGWRRKRRHNLLLRDAESSGHRQQPESYLLCVHRRRQLRRGRRWFNVVSRRAVCDNKSRRCESIGIARPLIGIGACRSVWHTDAPRQRVNSARGSVAVDHARPHFVMRYDSTAITCAVVSAPEYMRISPMCPFCIHRPVAG